MEIRNGKNGLSQRWEDRAAGALIARPTGKVSLKKLMQLVQWQDFKCALTGRALTPETASLDHIVAVSNGGEHVLENLQVLHRDVNQAKRTLTSGEFVSLCREVVNHSKESHDSNNAE